MPTLQLSKAVNILLLLVLSFGILYAAKSFLVPLTLAAILAMLFVPFCQWMETKGLSRWLASLICVVCFAAIVALLFILLSRQLSGMGEDFSQIQENINRQLKRLQQYISNSMGISQEKQNEMLSEQSKQSSGNTGKAISAVISSLLGTATDTVLMLVYMFLLLSSRMHLKNFILRLVPANAEKQNAKKILSEITKVAQQYLLGLGMMILALWIMYGIGFSVVGVKYALFFAVLCGLLEIVPFIGNLTGTALTVLMTLAQGGSSGMVIGVLITYVTVQFLQTYILEPMVVGAQVNIRPLITIIALVIGELVWGIAGMVLAIPVTGIIKIICQHIAPLHPYAYLLGQEDEKKNKKTLFKRKKQKG